MRKKIFAIAVSAGLLAAPAVFAATVPTSTTSAAPAQAQPAPYNYGMPMMRGGVQLNDRDRFNSQYGMMQRGYGGHFGLLGAAHAITMLLVWILLIMLICALGMHLRRMRRGREWWIKNRTEGKPENKEETKL
jgi:hypothetical protein